MADPMALVAGLGVAFWLGTWAHLSKERAYWREIAEKAISKELNEAAEAAEKRRHL